jgi:DAACS family dicarboxylate/amino acid:cation (Na+ or H+) symporter
MPLHTRVLLGLLVGAGLGVMSNILWGGHDALAWVIDTVAQPIGQIFLRLLFMVVVPLIFTSVTLGVASLGDLRRVGRIGAKTLLFFLGTTALAVTIGLTVVNVVRPGDGVDPAVQQALMAQFSQQAGERVAAAETTGFGINTFVNIVPRNPVAAAASGDMLGLIFFSLVFGIALTLIPGDRASPVIRLLEGISDAVLVMIGFAMKIAPIGVAGLIFAVTARFGWDLLQSLLAYVITIVGALLLHQFGVIGVMAKVLTGIGPARFFGNARALMVTAFSTSSSNATLPTTIRTAETKFGVPREIAGFVLPIGATMNMNGTALFEGMTVLFLAQVFGLDLSIGTQLIVVVMSIITAIGAAGVPGGSIPLLVMILDMVGVPPEGIGLVLGVDRILDMSRTVPNVTADMITSIVIAKSEGYELVPATAPDFSSGAALEALEHEHEIEAEQQPTPPVAAH